MASFSERMIGAARLSVHAYEEVEADTKAFGQAMAVVAISSVAAGIGAAGEAGAPGLLAGLIAALLGWFLWAWLKYFIGTRILPEAQTHADWSCEWMISFPARPAPLGRRNHRSILSGS